MGSNLNSSPIKEKIITVMDTTKENLFPHQDKLQELAKVTTLQDKLNVINQELQRNAPFVDRVAIALLDHNCNKLKTFIAIHKNQQVKWKNYQTSLDEAPSLKELMIEDRPRVVNDLTLFNQGTHSHTQKIKEEGFVSSYTFPIRHQGHMLGFLFFNSYQKNVFEEAILNQLDVYAHLIGSMVVLEHISIQTLFAALRTTSAIVHHRDPETGNHLERMARYAQLIALKLSQNEKYNFSDTWIEALFLFSPLHDVGKIGIPDQILRKTEKLTEVERQVMKKHALLGRMVIDKIIEQFQFGTFSHIELLRNITEFHHETLDGLGYPRGLKGVDIPIEARIVSVADIFDALTNSRSYKPAWSNQQALEYLKQQTRDKLDLDCVNALVECMEQVLEIQEKFITI